MKYIKALAPSAMAAMFTPAEPHFFKLVFEGTLQDRRLRVPRKFVRKYGNDLLSCPEVKLIVPDGETWSVRVKVTESDGNVWFDNGWYDFAEYYSLQALHLLVFKYEGNFRFRVIILDDGGSEIEYPTREEVVDSVDVDPDKEETDEEEVYGVQNLCRRSWRDKGKSIVEDVEEVEVEAHGGETSGEPEEEEANGVENLSRVSCQDKGKGIVEDVEEAEEVEAHGGETSGEPEEEEANGVENLCRVSCQDRGKGIVEDVEEAEEVEAHGGESSEEPEGVEVDMEEPNGIENLCIVSSQDKGKSIVEAVEEAEEAEEETNGYEGSEESEEEEGDEDESNEDYGVEKANDDSGSDESWCREEIMPSSSKRRRRQKSQSPHSPPLKMLRTTPTNEGETDPSGLTATERANKFKSENPFFVVEMQPSYIIDPVRNKTGRKMVLPAKFIKQHLKEKSGDIKLCISDDMTWSVRYLCYETNNKYSRAVIHKGWSEFMLDNQLAAGDVCVFELIDQTEMKFKVIIYRATRDPNESSFDAPLPSHKKAAVALERASGFKSKKPYFKVVMQPAYLRSEGKGNSVYIPHKFSKEYLDGKEQVILKASGRSWTVKHCVYATGAGQLKAKLYHNWGAFVQDNGVKIGNVCFFELIDRDRARFKVSIF